VTVPITYTAKCEARSLTVGSVTIPFGGVLTAYATAALPTSVTLTTTTVNATTGAQIGQVSTPVALSALSPALQAALATYVGGSSPIPLAAPVQLGYLSRSRTTTDIPAPEQLLAMLAQAQSLLGGAESLNNLDPAVLLAILQNPDLVDLILTISPIFNPLQHAYHPACRSGTETRQVVIPFTETANHVMPRSGNESLNFRSWLGDASLHYNKNQNVTRGSGYLLSDGGLAFIDLNQFDGRSGNLVGTLMNGGEVQARACLTAAPWQCTTVTLRTSVPM
jgi:hypothetical protein